MIILSHRGYWQNVEESNTLFALEKSFAKGFGVEVDFRDYLGDLVISHDIPNAESPRAEDMFQLHKQINSNLPLAINIKSDGLQESIIKLLNQFQITNYFVFDMSLPDALGYLKYGINSYTRQSEYEIEPLFYTEAKGIWIDCFIRDWVDEKTISYHLAQGKQICLVSPELHSRDHQIFWDRIRGMVTDRGQQILLCTDFPDQARRFFNE